jgi:hypothetical protein
MKKLLLLLLLPLLFSCSTEEVEIPINSNNVEFNPGNYISLYADYNWVTFDYDGTVTLYIEYELFSATDYDIDETSIYVPHNGIVYKISKTTQTGVINVQTDTDLNYGMFYKQ